MVAQAPLAPARAFIARREAVSRGLTHPAVLFAGTLRGRNYPANVYPFRADSQFLYLVGIALPGAAVLLHEGSVELFVPPDAPDDALWHGNLPSAAELAAFSGIDRVSPRDELPRRLQRLAPAATLPCTDPVTRVEQARLLGRTWPLERAPRIDELTDIDLELADAMIARRLVHDEAAISMMRRALEGTAAAHRAGMAVTRPGIVEHEVRAAMEREFIARGMECAYNPIVTVHGEVLHSNRYDNPLEPGQLLLADVGGELQGWASDITRTWPVTGKFDAAQKDVYEIVLAAQLEAIGMVAPQVRYRDIHLHASLVLARGLVDLGILRGEPSALVERGAHALFFPHGVGHLIGLDVHDMEDLGDRAGYATGRDRSTQFGLAYLRLDRDLEPGMAVTIEPGLYFVPAILQDTKLTEPFDRDKTLNRERMAPFVGIRGIRIEDDVLCTPTGPDVLSREIPKGVDEVEAAVGVGLPH